MSCTAWWCSSTLPELLFVEIIKKDKNNFNLQTNWKELVKDAEI